MSQLLSDAHRLEIHPEYRWDTILTRTVMLQAMDFVDDGCNFFLIVLDRADHTDGGVESVDIGDFRGVEVIYALAGRAIDNVISRVFIRPGCAAASGFDHLEDRVGFHRVVRVNWFAVTLPVQSARQPSRVDDVQRNVRGRVLVDALVEHDGVASTAGTTSVGRIEQGTVIADVVEQPMRDR